MLDGHASRDKPRAGEGGASPPSPSVHNPPALKATTGPNLQLRLLSILRVSPLPVWELLRGFFVPPSISAPEMRPHKRRQDHLGLQHSDVSSAQCFPEKA